MVLDHPSGESVRVNFPYFSRKGHCSFPLHTGQLQFPPAQNNLSISYDSGKTWTSIGDADYFYGSVTEDGSSISYFPGALEIRDGYVYTTAVYDINHEKSSDPLVTHSVRVNLKTGAQEILD